MKDTIIALATPPGKGGISIIRISGNLSLKISKIILHKILPIQKAEYLSFFDLKKNILDKGIALFFASPNSFTGEDILELHCHGSPITVDLLLKCILNIPGIRIANPGEFTERAFLNKKLDLIQAEAIADLINANSIQSANQAINSLQGLFSSKINYLNEQIINLRVYIESMIDFSDSQIDFLSKNELKEKFNLIINDIKKEFLNTFKNSIYKEEFKIVLVGKPNSGKSSLFNILSNKSNAIVTSIAGTTRDILKENININGINICLIDTAGLHSTKNKIEKIGIKKTLNEIKQADHIFYLIDSNFIKKLNLNNIFYKFQKKISSNVLITFILNKADISKEKIGIINNKNYSIITISIKTNKGIDILKKYLFEKISSINFVEQNHLLIKHRNLNLLNIVIKHLRKAKILLLQNNYIDLVAEELRLAQISLDKITGKFTTDDLLKKIFSKFCIGK